MPATAEARTQAYYRKALEAARRSAESADPEQDGGTCNLDKVYVRDIENPEALKEAAEAVGLRASSGYGIAEGGYFILRLTKGQGNRRTKMAEAAAKTLQAEGLDAHMFYQID